MGPRLGGVAALVALVFLGILATVAMRPTRGGRRAAAWLAVLAGAMLVSTWLEPAQQTLLLFGTADLVLTPLVHALNVGLVGLILSAVGEARRPDDGEVPVAATAAAPDPAAAPARSGIAGGLSLAAGVASAGG